MSKNTLDKVVNTGVVEKSFRSPRIIKRKFARITEKLYRAIVNNEGLYANVKMETHAPQTKYYPGSKNLKSIPESISPQTDLFYEEVESTPEQKIESNSFVTLKPQTLEHRRWLWFATLTDRREISERVYRAHCRIYEDHPEFYNKEVNNISIEQFREVFRKKSYKIGSPYQSAGYWLTCAKTLFEEFDGDPVLLLKSAGWSVENVYAWKKLQKKLRGYDPIPGWGRKLLSLYFMYLAELGFQLPDDAFPADVHAQAISLQTESFDFGSKKIVYSSHSAEMIRKESSSLCKEKKWDPVIVAHSKWLLGSQLCTKCSTRSDVPYLCPIFKECKGRVETGSYFAHGQWRKDGKNMTKGGERPSFGLPTDISPRDRSRKTTREPIPITPLLKKLK